MKILRLESDTDLFKSVFTNNLAVPLQVAPNARVAIKTLSMQFVPEKININSLNNVVMFKLGTGSASQEVKIPSGNYTVQQLVDTFEAYMNNMCPSDSATSLGMEFLWGYIDGSVPGSYRFQIGYTINELSDINEGNTDLDEVEFQGGFFKDPAAPTSGLYTSSFVTQHFSCYGGWNYTFTIDQQPDPGTADVKDSKWFFGMGDRSKIDASNIAVSIVNNMDNGLGSSETGTYIYKNDAGVMIDTGLVITIGDVIDVYKQQVDVDHIQVVYTIKQGTSPASLFVGKSFLNSNVTVPQPLIEVFCKFGDDTGKILISNTQFIQSSTSQVSTNGEFTKSNISSLVNIRKMNKSIKAVDPVAVEIDLSQQLADTLGFTDAILKDTGVAKKWTSDGDSTTNLFNNDILVEIPEFGFDGYDQRTQQKRSILMVITSGAVQQSTQAKGLESYELSYTDNFPTYMNINNSIATTFSSLTVRVISEDTTLAITGKIVCTLLVKDETDFEIKL